VKKNEWDQVLVFCKTKHGANRLASQLQKDRINADAIHGNKSQNARIRALEDFKAGKVKVLVATDIAARGLDIEELPHVVNFDLPHIPEDYVHRIGRTGRAGLHGRSVVARLRGGSSAARRDRAPHQPQDRGPGSRRLRPWLRRPTRAGTQAEAKPQLESQGKPRAKREPGQGERGQGERGQREQGQRETGRRERKERDNRAPRLATSPPPRTSGDSGGMDFNKPYEPAPSKEAIEQPDENPVRKRPSQAIPALFRRKAA
jgi:ATP-dependent RNA helicase RhlE